MNAEDKQVTEQSKEQLQKDAGHKLLIRRVFLLCMVMCVMCVSAFAENEVTVSGMLTSSGTLVASAMSTVWSIVTANEFLTALVGCSLIAIGFRFFRMAKRAARH